MNGPISDAERLNTAADAVLMRRAASEPMVALALGQAPHSLGSVAMDKMQADATFYATVGSQLWCWMHKPFRRPSARSGGRCKPTWASASKPLATMRSTSC